jgi:hypothetical protein
MLFVHHLHETHPNGLNHDIGITNGTINSGSFTKVSETQYTVMVTPSLGGKHSNVAVKNRQTVIFKIYWYFPRARIQFHIPSDYKRKKNNQTKRHCRLQI